MTKTIRLEPLVEINGLDNYYYGALAYYEKEDEHSQSSKKNLLKLIAKKLGGAKKSTVEYSPSERDLDSGQIPEIQELSPSKERIRQQQLENEDMPMVVEITKPVMNTNTNTVAVESAQREVNQTGEQEGIELIGSGTGTGTAQEAQELKLKAT